MNTRMSCFLGAAGAALAAYAAFFLRFPDTIAAHGERHGALGVAVAVAAMVMFAGVAGLLALAARPGHWLRAAAYGLVPPALVLVAGLPDPVEAAGGEGGLAPTRRRALESIGLVLAPVRAAARAANADLVIEAREQRAAAKAAGKARDIAEAARGKEKATAAQAHRTAVEQLKAQATADRQAAVEAAVKAERTKAEAETMAAVTRAGGDVLRLSAELEALTAAKGAVDAAHAAARADLERMRAQVALADARGAETSALEAALKIAQESDTQARRTLADYRRLTGWVELDLEVDRPLLTVLGRRLASRDPEERQVAARLLGAYGPGAQALLRRALQDQDDSVRREVQTALTMTMK